MTEFNTIMNNIRNRQGKFDDADIDILSNNNDQMEQKQNNSEEEEKAHTTVIETPQLQTSSLINNTRHTTHTNNTRNQETDNTQVHNQSLIQPLETKTCKLFHLARS